jgi:hypothetical protein
MVRVINKFRFKSTSNTPFDINKHTDEAIVTEIIKAIRRVKCSDTNCSVTITGSSRDNLNFSIECEDEDCIAHIKKAIGRER